MNRICQVGPVVIGQGEPLAIIAGPCTLESFDLSMQVGERLRDKCRSLGLPFVFKASFDKANRSSVRSARGPGMADGLATLERVGRELGVPLTTDLHDASQAQSVAEVVDMLQIPAFLCRQTDLLVAAGVAAKQSHRSVNVKKGQFLSPREMAGPIRKLAEAGCENTMLTERGTFFGYHRLVNDFIGIGDLMDLDCSAFSKSGSPPVCFDVTHSTQLPGSGEQTGGRPDRAALLARAAAAIGVHALFIEAHPNPAEALSDGATQLTIDHAELVLDEVATIRTALSEIDTGDRP